MDMGSDSRVPRLSDHELRFARRIEEVLQAENVLYERSDVERPPPIEPYVQFELPTSPDLDLRVTLIVHGDVFVINVNETNVRIESDSYPPGMEEAWLDDSVAMLDYLITHDLRMKTRRGLLGGRTGAIYFESINGERGWSGEIFAIWCGKKQEYSNWLKRRAP
jgi:hypothetical protein